jgi:hypothetical protein
VIDLDAALTDLADHLDHPRGDHIAEAVLMRISAEAPSRSPRAHRRSRPSRARVVLAVAAAIVLIAGTILAVAPARRAIADWLGIGAVQIVTTDHPLPTGSSALTVPGAPDATPTGASAQQFAAAQKAVSFTIATPRDPAIGPLLGVATDSRVPGGLVALRYKGFTLVEIATNRNVGGETVGKFIGSQTRTESVTVAGSAGLWVTGAHQIGYLSRSGNVETETVRRAGPVLLWARNGVTYRVEGVPHLTDALAIATSIASSIP